jgi:uncharacterized hydrophobic protein (TIGR00271 family)
MQWRPEISAKEISSRTSRWTAAAQRRLKALLFLLSRKTSHEEVIEQVRADGMLSGRYVFMAVMSCAIATLGLLLSSPAVIIGAMLISPLMGPIMLMGFSLTILDFSAMRRAVISMACGVAAALTISFLIVKLSPLTEVTPEILARTRPNLFDLLVAIFSGLAGGYAVIQRQGATIVGVAIATALMPPLAVTGYGLAVGSLAIAGGSFFLFMTNLLAIALSVTVLSAVYGFASGHGRKQTFWQGFLVIAVFIALSIPLGLSLRDIAYEARTINRVKTQMLVPFEGRDARVSDVSIVVPRQGDIAVSATILTHEPLNGADAALKEHLSEYLGRPVDVNLAQVLIDENRELEAEDWLRRADATLAAPLRAQMAAMSEQRGSAESLRAAVLFELDAADIDPALRKARLIAARTPGYTLGAYREAEAAMSRNFEGWTIEVVPPRMEMPRIVFDSGTKLSEEGAVRLTDSIWALHRWKPETIAVTGYASSSGSAAANRQMALRRAETIVAALAEAGLEAEARSDFQGARQAAEERRLGTSHFIAASISAVN